MTRTASSTGILDAARVLEGQHPGPVTFLPGSTILREGEAGSCAYMVESGQVHVSKRSDGVDRPIAVLGPGNLIGEMAAIDEQVRSATVTALTQVEVVPISHGRLEAMIEQADPLLNLMLRAMFNRLREAQERSAAPMPRDASSAWSPQADERYRRAMAAASDQLKLDRALADAIRRREFVLQYQPIVSVVDRTIVGFEALIRWFRPEVGMVPPSSFVSAAERTGLIVPIGLWVLEQAGFILRRLRGARRARGDGRDLFMTVNVSARQLREPADVEALCAAVRASGAEPNSIKLEITENVLMENAEFVHEALQRVRATGVQLAIDDFGTGYSSLSYLHRYPVDVLKIDRSFTSSMLNSESSRRLMGSIIGLARGLDLDVVAEGIEQEAELEMLRDMGCAYGQGYLFSRPLNLEDAEQLLG